MGPRWWRWAYMQDESQLNAETQDHGEGGHRDDHHTGVGHVGGGHGGGG